MRRAPVSAWAVRGLYLLALILILSPLVDLISTVWPLRPGDLSWRYGLLGLLGSYVHTAVLGFALGMAAAYVEERNTLLRVFAVTGLVCATALVLAMGLFALDVLQMRALRAEGLRAATLVSGGVQEIKYLAATLVLVCLGAGGVGTARRVASRAHRGRERGPGIIRGAPTS